MKTAINAVDVKKELYKTKVDAKFSYYSKGKLFYTVELMDGKYQFPISTVDEMPNGLVGGYLDVYKLSADLGETYFHSEIKASELNRWIAKAISNNEFIKIS